MAKFTGFYKIVTPQAEPFKMADSQNMTDFGTVGNYTWYSRLIQGSSTRLSRYNEWSRMDTDVLVAKCLDTIAEEVTGNMTSLAEDPIEVDVIKEDSDTMDSTTAMTLKAALRRWSSIHDFENKLFKIARTMLKYGDVFFRKTDDFKKWEYIHPKNVLAAIVDKEDLTKIIAWQIREDMKQPQGSGLYTTTNTGTGQDKTTIVPAAKMVRFTLNDDMSDSAPFGESILQPVYRAYKQKELLEDAVVIYRIQRAPERRVFYIDVGKMPPARAKQHLESIKNEIKQKKIPTAITGPEQVDSVYNPMSMSEDYFFAVRPDGKGSKVDTLPGGQATGEISDLEFFNNKVLEGLRIPQSYMNQGQDNALFNDGKVGTAYIQELRFALFIKRLQGYIARPLDDEFKMFLRKCGIRIDEFSYRLKLPEPSNFGKYRQQEIDAALLNTYSSADSIPHIAKRYALKYYLQWTDEQILENERLKLEELGKDPNDKSPETMMLLYGTPSEGMGMGGMGSIGGLGGASMGMSPPMGGGGMDGGGEVPPSGDMGGTAPATGGTPPPA